ncbi:MAG: tRNA pseudouridine(55) synthase TruB [Desulfotomaculaceae bacterium]|nr:tRNA pseudouridine(55) synthase TruB [Desulfotomaculaceae bacterium]
MNGIINVLKPPGMTSHDVVDFIRRTCGLKKAGHTGTLDPGAAGVLVICLGVATRLARFFLEDDKEYRAEITFGLSTSSGDAYGDITGESDATNLTEDTVRAVLPLFTGIIGQTPPMTSALKRHGKKLYELARAGKVVEREERVVNIYDLKFIWGTGWGGPRPSALLHISCQKGVYVRSLCDDIGASLGCGAYMSFLVRTRAGPFNISESHTLEELLTASSAGNIREKVIAMNDALSIFPAVVVKRSSVLPVLSGAKLYPPGVFRIPEGLVEGERVRLVGPEGLLAVAETTFEPDDRGRFVFKPICTLARQN